MGGLGSGDKYWLRKKTTVEESLDFSMKNFRSQIFPNSAGQTTWTYSTGKKSSIGFRVNLNETGSVLTLDYRVGGTEDIRIPIRLQTTPMQFGGIRWWFTCPLIVDVVVCSGRVGNLYLPPGAKYFGCRRCHRLAYRSSQRAHFEERSHKFRERLIKDYGITRREA